MAFLFVPRKLIPHDLETLCGVVWSTGLILVGLGVPIRLAECLFRVTVLARLFVSRDRMDEWWTDWQHRIAEMIVEGLAASVGADLKEGAEDEEDA